MMVGMKRAHQTLSLALLAALAAASPALAQGEPPTLPVPPTEKAPLVPDMTPPETPSEGTPKDPARLPPRAERPSLDELFTRLAAAQDDKTAAALAREIEGRFRDSGSPTIDVLMGQSARAIEANDFALARDLLDAVVRLKPDYAEGWNRRAAVAFQADDYGLAIADIERALILEPRHFGALSGLGTLLRHLEREEDALRAYEAVLELNPRNPDAKKAREDLKRSTHGLDL